MTQYRCSTCGFAGSAYAIACGDWRTCRNFANARADGTLPKPFPAIRGGPTEADRVNRIDKAKVLNLLGSLPAVRPAHLSEHHLIEWQGRWPSRDGYWPPRPDDDLPAIYIGGHSGSPPPVARLGDEWIMDTRFSGGEQNIFP